MEMPYLAEIAAFLVPILVRFINKHSDDFMEQLFSKIGSLISAKTDGAVLIVSTSPLANVEFDRGDGKIIKRIADEKGFVQFNEPLEKGDTINITAYGEGYIQDTTTLVIDNEYITYHVSLKLRSRKKRTKAVC